MLLQIGDGNFPLLYWGEDLPCRWLPRFDLAPPLGRRPRKPLFARRHPWIFFSREAVRQDPVWPWTGRDKEVLIDRNSLVPPPHPRLIFQNQRNMVAPRLGKSIFSHAAGREIETGPPRFREPTCAVLVDKRATRAMRGGDRSSWAGISSALSRPETFTHGFGLAPSQSLRRSLARVKFRSTAPDAFTPAWTSSPKRTSTREAERARTNAGFLGLFPPPSVLGTARAPEGPGDRRSRGLPRPARKKQPRGQTSAPLH